MKAIARAEVISLLIQTMEEQAERDQRIREFQRFVFHTAKPPADFSQEDWEILADLAYDLDFYVSDPNLRREDASYYGEERLVSEIRESLAKLGAS
jgi:hypothetical protein